MAKHVKSPSAVFKNPSIYERSDLKIGKFRVNSQTGKNETYSGTDWLPGKWIYHSKNIPIPTKHVLFDDVHGYGKSIGNAYGPWLELTEEVIQYGYDQPRPLGIGTLYYPHYINEDGGFNAFIDYAKAKKINTFTVGITRILAKQWIINPPASVAQKDKLFDDIMGHMNAIGITHNSWTKLDVFDPLGTIKDLGLRLAYDIDTYDTLEEATEDFTKLLKRLVADSTHFISYESPIIKNPEKYFGGAVLPLLSRYRIYKKVGPSVFNEGHPGGYFSRLHNDISLNLNSYQRQSVSWNLIQTLIHEQGHAIIYKKGYSWDLRSYKNFLLPGISMADVKKYYVTDGMQNINNIIRHMPIPAMKYYKGLTENGYNSIISLVDSYDYESILGEIICRARATIGIGQWKSLEVLMPNLNKFFTQEYIDLLYDVSESIKPSSSAGINKYLYHKVLNNILLSNGGGQVAATYAANYNIAHDSDIEIAPFESTNRDTFW